MLTAIFDRLAQWWKSRCANPPTPLPPPCPAPLPTPIPTPPTASPIVRAINAARASNGLEALDEDDTLSLMAGSWASSMATSGTLSHGDFAGRISALYPNIFASENIAEGQPDADSVVDAWLHSPPHRANLLGDYNKVGAGSDRSGAGDRYWCADFGKIA